jgi:hypothetical protein
MMPKRQLERGSLHGLRAGSRTIALHACVALPRMLRLAGDVPCGRIAASRCIPPCQLGRASAAGVTVSASEVRASLR